MRVVADTNTVVSGLLWHGPPRQVLDAARAGTLQLYTTAVLLAELDEVLQRPKFAQRLTLAGVTTHALVLGYAALARLIEPAVIVPWSKKILMTMRCWLVRLQLKLRRLCQETAICLT